MNIKVDKKENSVHGSYLFAGFGTRHSHLFLEMIELDYRPAGNHQHMLNTGSLDELKIISLMAGNLGRTT